VLLVTLYLVLCQQVGQWGTCGGDASYGHSSRPVVCIDGVGSIVNPGSSTCMSAQPSSKVMCLTEATLTACRPSFLADWYFRGQDCYGHGLCGADGCDCKDGWRGQFCEVVPRCKGVMDRRDKCCTSGVLNITGDCCPAGSVLDSAGSCCAGGQVDVCGVCGGTSWTVDVPVSVDSRLSLLSPMPSSGCAGKAANFVCACHSDCCQHHAVQFMHLLRLAGIKMSTARYVALLVLAVMQGVCCSSMLDAYGLCCTSGAVDECGVCDGDGTSCSLHIRLLLQVTQGTVINGTGTPVLGGPTGSSAASTALVRWAQAAIQQAATPNSVAGTPQLELQATQVAAKWAAAVVSARNSSGTTQPVTTRHLMAGGGDEQGASPSSLCDASAKPVGLPADPSHASSGVQCPSPAPSSSSTESVSLPPDDAEAGPAARHLQQAAGAAEGPAVQLDIVLTPTNLVQLASSAGASAMAAASGSSSQWSAGMLGLGQVLAVGLEQQAPGSGTGGAGQAAGYTSAQLLRVMLVQRLGVCGNGVCEVGERQLLNSEGEVLQEADTPCAQVGQG
jgi:hypothetical protein